jgi:DNA replication and repair protein RecF
MHIQRLQLHCFKCHVEADLAFSPHVNLFVGPNGVGKTNVLDAVHYLCHTKSFFQATDGPNITHGEPGMLLRGAFEREGELELVSCGLQRGEKKVIRRNDKPVLRFADHVGRFPAVMMAPDDAALVHEGSEIRRKWMDSVISQFDRDYLDAVMVYNRAMLQRNMLLRQFGEQRFFDSDLLSIWDEKLIPAGERIASIRKRFLADFASSFEAAYQAVSKGQETPGWNHRTQLDPDVGSFAELLRESLSEDRLARRTTVGIHRDDLIWELDGHALKRFGSQGQQKSFLVALRLAQRKYIHARTQVAPILLLDDIFDKLDASRVGALMESIAQPNFGQVFITDTDHHRVANLFKEKGIDIRIFLVQPSGMEMIASKTDDFWKYTSVQ